MTLERTPEIIAAGQTLRPLHDHILLEPLEFEASETIEVVRFGRAVRGIVKAIGPGVYQKRYQRDGNGQRQSFRRTSVFVPTEVKPGDLVELGGLNVFDGQGYSFDQVLVDGKVHLICQEQDVAIVCDP